jgi:transcriptional regulator with XRE-family HTH domain
LKQTTSASLGTKLRHRRKLLGFTLSTVAKAADCSESMVSKIETDRVNPSLTMLRRLAAALDINVAKLFADAPVEGVVSHNGERPLIDTDVLRRGDQVSLERLIPYHDGTLLQANIHIVGPGGSSDGQITHVGEEMGYLLEGQLELSVDGRKYSIQPGDSFHFSSELSHGYSNPGAVVAKVLWVNTPPTF